MNGTETDRVTYLNHLCFIQLLIRLQYALGGATFNPKKAGGGGGTI